MIKKYKKLCPKCKEKIYFASKYNLKKSIDKNSKCKKCYMNTEEYKEKIRKSKIGKKRDMETRKNISKTRIERGYKGEKSPMYGKKFTEEHKGKLSIKRRLRITTDETRLKMSLSQKGRKQSEETIKKIRESQIGKKRGPRPQEVIKKIRLTTIKNIEKNKLNGHQLYPNFNPTACKIIDEYGKKYGYTFQHAMNGGEHHISDLGYWVDGYDENKNIVIEIDEKQHFDINGNLKKKDIRRQKEIKEFLKCGFIRLKSWENLYA